MSNPFVGTWTYRSFHNKPEPVQNFDEVRLAQAELVLEETGPNWLWGKLKFGNVSLDMNGVSAQVDRHWRLRMRGMGVSNTETAGWVYDYVGEMAAEWPTGDRQRPVIIGTVLRSLFHQPDRGADLSYSFVAVRKEPDPFLVPPLPAQVLDHFADRAHRLHHAVWHALRNSWHDLRNDQQVAIAELRWAPPRPARLSAPNGDILKPLVDDSGEDFLYFHREMVVMFRHLMAREGAPIVAWNTIPRPGAPGDAVPPAWPVPRNPAFERRIRALKTDEYYWSRMRWWDQQFKDPTYLSTLTLGEFGSLVEYSVHNDMHIRWSAPPRDPHTNALLPTGRPQNNTDEFWDNPKYDWLGDFYSSHVNPYFWRLHGWIDDRVTDWFQAHESKHPGQVEAHEKNGLAWYQTGGPWVAVEKPWVWPEHLLGEPGGHSPGRHGGNGTDPELRAKRIASLTAVLDVMLDRKPEPAVTAREVAEPSRISFIFGE